MLQYVIYIGTCPW